jgi:hypothetical protein
MVFVPYIFNHVFACIDAYRAWLKNGKYRAEKILYTPMVVIFLAVFFAPPEFFEWYFSSLPIAMIAPVVILLLLPFYVVTCLHVFRKLN